MILSNSGFIILIFFVLMIVFLYVIVFITRYKKCPSDKILVIYGKLKDNRSSCCIHGGTVFIWPLLQSYKFIDLTPFRIEIDMKNALSKQNIRIHVLSRFTIAVSTDPTIMINAAERLLGLQLTEIQDLAKDIIFGQIRLILATKNIEDFGIEHEAFLTEVITKIEAEINKIGLKLINTNLNEMSDESGYIHSLGKKGTVLKSIPSNKEGEGKVEVSVQGRILRFDAITEEKEIIEVHSNIVIVGIREYALLVKSI